jgi:hypothetical protein
VGLGFKPPSDRSGTSTGNWMAERAPQTCYVPQQISQGRPPVVSNLQRNNPIPTPLVKTMGMVAVNLLSHYWYNAMSSELVNAYEAGGGVSTNPLKRGWRTWGSLCFRNARQACGHYGVEGACRFGKGSLGMIWTSGKRPEGGGISADTTRMRRRR